MKDVLKTASSCKHYKFTKVIEITPLGIKLFMHFANVINIINITYHFASYTLQGTPFIDILKSQHYFSITNTNC